MDSIAFASTDPNGVHPPMVEICQLAVIFGAVGMSSDAISCKGDDGGKQEDDGGKQEDDGV